MPTPNIYIYVYVCMYMYVVYLWRKTIGYLDAISFLFVLEIIIYNYK